VTNLYSLRQHDLDQVIRVEHGLLLSVPHRGTPRSIVDVTILEIPRLSIQKKSRPNGGLNIINKGVASLGKHLPSNDILTYATTPFLFHLQFTRAEPGIERQEVGEQTVEPYRFVDHREMS